MRLTPGTFPLLSELTDDEIAAQGRYAAGYGWTVAVEFSDDPRPRHAHWKMSGPPLFDAPVTELQGRAGGGIRC